MEVNDKVWDLVGSRKMNMGYLATADGEGRPNAALLSSLQFADRETMTMLVGKNRSLENLKKNPYACFVTVSGETMDDVEGVRIYLRAREIIEEGPVVDRGRDMVAATMDERAAAAIKAFVTFEVLDVRPLVDVGEV